MHGHIRILTVAAGDTGESRFHSADDSEELSEIPLLIQVEFVVVVLILITEHDADTIRRAEHIIDLGPGAGVHGGEVVVQGDLEEVLASERSLTGRYLSGDLSVPVPTERVARRLSSISGSPLMVSS